MKPPRLDGVTHRTVAARGLRFTSPRQEPGSRSCSVHGWPQHWWTWRRVVPMLAPHARLVMIDLRGFGWSDAPPGGYDKQTMADDVLAVLDALELRRVRLVGHDWGAWIGFLACVVRTRALRGVPGAGRAAPARQAARRQLLQIWRFAYQVVLAAPVLGRRLSPTSASSSASSSQAPFAARHGLPATCERSARC